MSVASELVSPLICWTLLVTPRFKEFVSAESCEAAELKLVANACAALRTPANP